MMQRCASSAHPACTAKRLRTDEAGRQNAAFALYSEPCLPGAEMLPIEMLLSRVIDRRQIDVPVHRGP